MIRGLISNMTKGQNITVIFKHFADKATSPSPMDLKGMKSVACNVSFSLYTSYAGVVFGL